jgi:dTDP-glucose 4,6-dehydratase
VLDHGKGIALAYHQGRPGETYNIGGRNEKTNVEVVNAICQILDRLRPLPSGSYTQFITFVQDRAGHDRRYAIDATKIETELGWQAQENFETGIVKTVEWYVEKYEGGKDTA